MIRKAEMKDLDAVTDLALRLWPDHEKQEMRESMAAVMKGASAIFLASSGTETVGFAQCQLRHDYVEGTQSSPVGYLEGIYVAEGFRRKGIAGELLAACEGWAREQGCREFASDCELDNHDSLRFHLGLGFAEANRIICFTKKL